MNAGAHLSISRFLSRAGTYSRGTEAVLLLVLAYGVVEWALIDRSETVLYMILFATPFAAGTGLLTIAREGQLDLLFGAGVTREAIWRQTVLRAVGVPLVACLAAMPMVYAPSQPVFEVAGRAVAIVLFTGGVAFATGLRNPRFAAGVAWIFAPLMLVVSGTGMRVLAQLQIAGNGGASPPMQDLLLATLAFPGILLDPGAHALYAVAAATIGVVAIAVSRVVFLRAELSGKRSV